MWFRICLLVLMCAVLAVAGCNPFAGDTYYGLRIGANTETVKENEVASVRPADGRPSELPNELSGFQVPLDYEVARN